MITYSAHPPNFLAGFQGTGRAKGRLKARTGRTRRKRKEKGRVAPSKQAR